MKIIIAAGGTGGHITPGIAIATMLKQEGNEVIFVGTEKGLEVDLIPKAGFELKYIHAAGLKGGIINNMKAIFALQKGIAECKKIIKEYKPDVVIGTGGYVTAPLLMAGISLKIPTMIHESNALPGKTTKWLTKQVDCVAVGFEEAKKRLGNLKNIVCTGNPNKMGLSTLTQEQAKSKLGVQGKLVLVFGGSQGAKKINETMIELINQNKIQNYTLIYATGPKHYENIIEQIKNIPSNVKIEKYIYNMEEVMRASDLVICRSGALTVSEIATVGVPSILIPFPYAAENHQYYNAKTLEDVKAARIIEEKDLTLEKLQENLQQLLTDDKVLKQMARNAKQLENKNSLEKIKQEIQKIKAKE